MIMMLCKAGGAKESLGLGKFSDFLQAEEVPSRLSGRKYCLKVLLAEFNILRYVMLERQIINCQITMIHQY